MSMTVQISMKKSICQIYKADAILQEFGVIKTY